MGDAQAVEHTGLQVVVAAPLRMIAIVIGKDHDPHMVIMVHQEEGTWKPMFTSGHYSTFRASQAKRWG